MASGSSRVGVNTTKLGGPTSVEEEPTPLSVSVIADVAIQRPLTCPCSVLAGTGRCIAQIEGERQGRAEPGSPASCDNPVVTAVSDAWGWDPFAVAESVAGCYMVACAHHLQALPDLLEPPLPVLADLTVARAVLETAARAWWLYDPEVEPLDRLGRAWTERLYALTERDKLLRSFNTEPDDGGAVKAQATRAPRPTACPQGRIATGCGLVGPARRPPIWWAGWTPRAVSMPGAGGRGPPMVCRCMLLRSEAFEDDHSPTGLRLVERPRSLKDVYTVAALALQAHRHAFDRRLAYYGWDDTD